MRLSHPPSIKGAVVWNASLFGSISYREHIVALQKYVVDNNKISSIYHNNNATLRARKYGIRLPGEFNRILLIFCINIFSNKSRVFPMSIPRYFDNLFFLINRRIA